MVRHASIVAVTALLYFFSLGIPLISPVIHAATPYPCPLVLISCSYKADLPVAVALGEENKDNGGAEAASTQSAKKNQYAATITITVDTDEVLAMLQETLGNARVLFGALFEKLADAMRTRDWTIPDIFSP